MRSKATTRFAAAPMIALLCSCGGGGSSAPTPTPSPPAAPTVTVGFANAKTRVGVSDTLSWSSTGASSCTGIAGLAGAQPSSGSLAITPTSGGQFSYALSCTGAGGTTSQTTTLIVPMPVYPTSYENYKNLDLPPMQLPLNVGTVYTVQLASGSGFADFEQIGQYDYFASPLDAGSNSSNLLNPGTFYIYHHNANGSWTDITAKLVEPDPTTNQLPASCIMARKALVADFNGDGVPDVFLSCASDNTLEYPKILLSQPNGMFKMVTIPTAQAGYFHSSAAADIDGDGKIDIVLADPSQNASNRPPVWVLRNNGDGTFTEDHTNFANLISKAVWSLDFVSINGQSYLWVAGNDASTVFNGVTAGLYTFDATGTFSANPVLTFPEMGDGSPNCTTCNALSLDIVLNGSIAYVLRTDPAYDDYAIQRVDLTTDTASVMFQYTGPDFGASASTNPACIGVGGKWLDFIKPYGGKLVTQDLCRSPNLTMD